MASEYSTPPHRANCDCGHCPNPRLEERQNPFDSALVTMPRDNNQHGNASDSENERTKKDESIRQAPYLPRVQVWARDGGPYTLRIGHQWFHCDDLLINGEEYRQQGKKTVAAQPTTSGPSAAGKRKPMNRAQSYQRTRPDATPTITPTTRPTNAFVRQPSRDKIERSGRYDSQALPDPRRRQLVRKSAPRTPEPETTLTPRTSDSHVAADASEGQLVRYESSPNNPEPRYDAPRQPRPVRPGRVSRGSSYQVPVRTKAKKAVRFDIAK